MEITEKTAEGILIAILVGRLDTATGPTVDARLLPLLAPGARLVADLAGVHHVSSAGLRVLLKAARRARAAGAAFTLAAPRPAVRDVLEASGFDQVLAIHPSRAAAVAALNPPP